MFVPFLPHIGGLRSSELLGKRPTWLEKFTGSVSRSFKSIALEHGYLQAGLGLAPLQRGVAMRILEFCRILQILPFMIRRAFSTRRESNPLPNSRGGPKDLVIFHEV